METITQLREEVGSSILDSVIKAFMRQRLENGAARDKRKHFPWSKYQLLYLKQNGVCWWCLSDMKLIKGQIQIEHFDPNAKDYNANENLSVVHNKCNQEKGAKTLVEQAEYLRITIEQLIRRFNQCR